MSVLLSLKMAIDFAGTEGLDSTYYEEILHRGGFFCFLHITKEYNSRRNVCFVSTLEGL